MNNGENKRKENKLKFNTYCIFSKEKQSIEETIGLIFKDYLKNLEIKLK